MLLVALSKEFTGHSLHGYKNAIKNKQTSKQTKKTDIIMFAKQQTRTS